MRPALHAQTRMQQRGFHGDFDTELFAWHAAEFREGLIMRRKDVEEAIASKRAEVDYLTAEIKRLEKLQGKALITTGNTIVTAYHPSKRRAKKFLRGTD